MFANQANPVQTGHRTNKEIKTMNHTKTLAAALLLTILPFATSVFASDREYSERGRGHGYEQHENGHYRGHHYGHHRPHFRHYYRHHGHHRRGHGYDHSNYDRWDNRASVTLPFPPLPPFPVIIWKH